MRLGSVIPEITSPAPKMRPKINAVIAPILIPQTLQNAKMPDGVDSRGGDGDENHGRDERAWRQVGNPRHAMAARASAADGGSETDKRARYDKRDDACRYLSGGTANLGQIEALGEEARRDEPREKRPAPEASLRLYGPAEYAADPRNSAIDEKQARGRGQSGSAGHSVGP